MAALHSLGRDYQSIFAPTDSNPLLEQTPAAAALLIHSKEALGPRLLLSYNAQAAAGRMLYNTADMDAAARDTERDTAAVQEGSQLCCTCHLRDLLHCLGGVSVLLPLVRLSYAVTVLSRANGVSRWGVILCSATLATLTRLLHSLVVSHSLILLGGEELCQATLWVKILVSILMANVVFGIWQQASATGQARLFWYSHSAA